MLILDQGVASFHAVVVFGLSNDLLFNSVPGHCATSFAKKQGFFFDPEKTKVLEKSRMFSSNLRSFKILFTVIKRVIPYWNHATP